MGVHNRKNRGGNQQKRGAVGHNGSSLNGSNHKDNSGDVIDGKFVIKTTNIKVIERTGSTEESDFYQFLQDIETNFLMSWREVFFFIIAIMLLAFMSICVGVAAGMAISIHYYDNYHPQVRGFHEMARDVSSLYNGLNAFKRVTILDPHIAAFNIMEIQPKSKPKAESNSDSEPIDSESPVLNLAKVITTTLSGHLNVLMVVDEVPQLEGQTEEKEYHRKQNNGRNSVSENDATDDRDRPDDPLLLDEEPNRKPWDPVNDIRKPTVLPALCRDGENYGFSSWRKLKAAIEEANSISAEYFMKRNEYLVMHGEDSIPYNEYELYDHDVYMPICPDTTLLGRRDPIYINSRNIKIECLGCTISAGGTHMSFGPHARNILVRGVTFRHAWSSSLNFFHDNAEAAFEDCTWIGNGGVYGKYGAVADVNSTSVISFSRCQVGRNVGRGDEPLPDISSALSLRRSRPP